MSSSALCEPDGDLRATVTARTALHAGAALRDSLLSALRECVVCVVCVACAPSLSMNCRAALHAAFLQTRFPALLVSARVNTAHVAKLNVYQVPTGCATRRTARACAYACARARAAGLSAVRAEIRRACRGDSAERSVSSRCLRHIEMRALSWLADRARGCAAVVRDVVVAATRVVRNRVLHGERRLAVAVADSTVVDDEAAAAEEQHNHPCATTTTTTKRQRCGGDDGASPAASCGGGGWGGAMLNVSVAPACVLLRGEVLLLGYKYCLE